MKSNLSNSFDLFTLNPEIPFKLEEQKFEEDIVSDMTSNSLSLQNWNSRTVWI